MVTRQDVLSALAPHEQSLEPEQFAAVQGFIRALFASFGADEIPINEAGQSMLCFGLMFSLLSEAIEAAKARGAN